jgi:hypothetical protein
MWVQTVISATSALFGGFVGGWVVAFRLGRWRQRVEDHLESIESRLLKGDRYVDGVPVLKARVDLILEELRIIKGEECDRRHKDA